MKKIIMIIRLAGILFTFFFSLSSIGQIKKSRLIISHLTGDFYVYTTFNDYNGQPFPSNSMYVVTDAGIVMIDTPWDTTQFQPLLDSVYARHRKKVVYCIATHFHDDRTSGFDFLKSRGIPAWTSLQTLQLCKEKKEKQADHIFTKDTTFQIGGLNFKTIYPGEGHTKDNIVIWFEKDKVLYGGCFVKSTESNSPGNLSDANVQAWPESVKNLMRKVNKPEFVIPGHMGWTDNKSLEHTIRIIENYLKIQQKG